VALETLRWRGDALDSLVAKLTALHRDLLTNSQSSEVLLAQGLTEIARKAASARRR